MEPISAEIEIDAPRDRAFGTIADLAWRPSFTDHFLADFHLTRLDSTGVGAGARSRVAPSPRPTWMETPIVELDSPHKLVERGRGGRGNRISATTVWELIEGSGSLTKVRVSHWTEPKPLDRLLEAASGAAFRQERAWREALRRLRDQLEDGSASLSPVAVAGGNAHLTGVP
jgi:Activator of Hsp90 ATPase homolog 1-like protein